MWIYPLGECRVYLENCSNGKKYFVNIIVVEQDFTPISDCRLIMRIMIILVLYDDMFSEKLGILPGEINLTVDARQVPVTVNSCKVPVSIKLKVIKEFKQMEKDKVITKIDEPTEWVNNVYDKNICKLLKYREIGIILNNSKTFWRSTKEFFFSTHYFKDWY